MTNLKISEDQYLNFSEDKLVKDKFIVLSGCSGGGKSSILAELSKRGYRTILEPGRQIVKEQQAIGGKGLPWNNLDHFLELALSRNLLNFNSTDSNDDFVFFDRSIIDTIQLDHPNESHFRCAARRFRYHKTVFLVPPWKEIYQEDSERKHSFEDGLKEYESLLKKYTEYGYQVELVPKTSVSDRVDWIISKLKYKA